MGDAHEADIAEWTKGSLQKASGSQWHAQGDTKNHEILTPYPITGDGKSTLGKSISVSLSMWRKIREQTFGQIPAIFLRFYKDDRLREVEADLTVLDSQTFSEILADARKWQELQAGLDKCGAIPMPVGDKAETDLYFCPSAEEVESATGGGFEVCCREPDSHVPLPPGKGAEALMKLLSDRQEEQLQVVPPVLYNDISDPRPQFMTHPSGATHPYNRPCFECGRS